MRRQVSCQKADMRDGRRKRESRNRPERRTPGDGPPQVNTAPSPRPVVKGGRVLEDGQGKAVVNATAAA